jgi:Phosphodiester glycosidase
VSHSARLRSRGETLAIACTLIALVGIAARVAGEEARASAWNALAPGLWYRIWPVEAEDSTTADAYVFRADPRVVHMTVVDARRSDRKVARAATLRAEAQAYLVVNGGFFDENAEPLGLVVGDGKQMSPLRKVDQGVFLISMGKPLIQHSRDPLPVAIDAALQSGPRLVVDGRALRLKPQVSRRTSVCLPGDGTVMVIVVPSPVSLSDLARNLARSATDGGLGCWSALNLDGGPSSQLSVATPGLNLEVEGGWGIPNGLAIGPRTGAPPPAP